MLEICAGFEVGEGDVARSFERAEAVDDDAAKLTIDVRMADEEVQGPAE